MGFLVELFTRERPRDGHGFAVNANTVDHAIREATRQASRDEVFSSEELGKLGVIVEGPTGVLCRRSPKP